MAFRYPSGSNTFTPSYESTLMMVSAIRDQARFRLPRYLQYVETKLRVFLYGKMDLDEPARIVTQNEFLWAPGQDAPTYGDIAPFQFVQASTTKYGFGWILPNEAIDQAMWTLDSAQMAIVAQKAMTSRTISTAAIAQTASNWPASNTAIVNTLNGGAGKWDTASSDPADVKYQAIKKSITKAYTAIVLQTNAAIDVKDLNLVVSPTLSQAMGVTSEVVDYTKGSPDAFARQEGTEEKFFGEFGMPPRYSNVNLIVENAVKVTSRPNVGSAGTSLGNQGTRGWVWADASPTLLARKGGIDGKFGSKDLSPVQLYWYRDMETFTKNDVDNERQMGRVVDDYVVVLPYGQSGFMFQNAV